MKPLRLSPTALAATLGLVALFAPAALALHLPALDRGQVDTADRQRVSRGRVAHFAVPRQVDVDPWRSGEWSAVETSARDTSARETDARVTDAIETAAAPQATASWTFDIEADGATSLSLHFDRFELPAGAQLVLRGHGFTSRPLTMHDGVGGTNALVAQLWTPPILGSRLDLELTVPIAGLDQVDLHLDRVYHGYAGFAAAASPASACRLDTACLGESPYDPVDPQAKTSLATPATEASSVALLLIDGVRFCTGFLITDANQSGRPLLLTAAHCGLNQRTAESLVVLWNYRRAACTDPAPAPARQFQSGATLLVKNTQTDIALLELKQRPDPSWQVSWAGWDRSDDPLGSALTVHHPDAAPQSLARAGGANRSRHFSYLDDPVGDHLRVDAWTQGTTEGGSSGAPLFDGEGRVRGWLRGGHAACDNRLPDWFGRLADAWDDPRGPGYRLRDWLDPNGTEMIAVDALPQR